MTRHRRLVAGIGFRRGTPSDAIVALIRRAMGESGHGDTLVAVATAADRAGDPAIREAARAFGLVPLPVDAEALLRADPRVPTRSPRIERLRGVGSVAEAAALAVAGDTGHLLLRRIDDGRATCALAVMGRGTADVQAGTTIPVQSESVLSEGGGNGKRGERSGTPPSPRSGRDVRSRAAWESNRALPFPRQTLGLPKVCTLPAQVGQAQLRLGGGECAALAILQQTPTSERAATAQIAIRTA